MHFATTTDMDTKSMPHRRQPKLIVKPIHAHQGAKRLELKRMRQTPQEFVAPFTVAMGCWVQNKKGILNQVFNRSAVKFLVWRFQFL